MALTLAVVLCLGSGFALVRLGYSCHPMRVADLLLQASLSIGFGLGIFSLIFFLSLVFHDAHLLLIDAIVCVALFSICVLFWHGAGPNSDVIQDDSSAQLPVWFRRFLTAAFAIAVAGALYSAITRVRAYPHGDGWDSFAIWNLHARFLFRGGPNWRDGFTSLLSWSRPDYPLLLPSAIAHFWTILGNNAPAIPAVIALLFTVATAGALFSALLLLHGRVAAMLGSIALLATPAFIREGTSQYGDIPLSFFILATVAFLCLHDAETNGARLLASRWLMLAGFSSAFGAWTKNEGLLFLVVLVVARFLVLIPLKAPREHWASTLRETATILVAAAPILLVIAYFKHSIAPPDDVFADPATTLHRLFQPDRYWIVLQWYAKEFLRFGDWLLIPTTLTMAALYFAAGKYDHLASSAVRASVLALVLTLAGCSVVYLITSYEIHWHLRFSLNRLFLQLWPSTIFLLFLVVKIPDDRQIPANAQLSVSK
jgi:Dolichyl-phosphate-mannose-protein mannosyltransferase